MPHPVPRATRLLAVLALLTAAVFVYRSVAVPVRYTAEATVALATADGSMASAAPKLAALAAPSPVASIQVLPVPSTRLVVVRSVASDAGQAAVVANDVAHAYVRSSVAAA